MIGYAVALADATPAPGRTRPGRARAADRVRLEPARADRPGAGGQRAGAAARPRPRHREDVRDLAADVLRHRIVLSYDALSDGVTVDQRARAAARRRRPSPTSTDWRVRSRGRMTPRPRAWGRPPLVRAPGRCPRALIDADRRADRCAWSPRTLPGDRRATGVGFGTELAQLRPYEPGDDVRHIDAAASARTGQPHVRLHVPERALTTWIVLDLSPSMAFGTRAAAEGRRGRGHRARVRAARGAARRQRRRGRVRRAGEPILLPPRGSRPGLVALRKLLEAGVAPDGRRDAPGWPAPSSGSPRSRSAAGARRRHLRLPRPGRLGAAARRRCAYATPSVAFEISDPREAELPALGRLALVDPESGERLVIDTSSRRVRRRFEALERERRERLAGELVRLRVPHVALGTESDWLLALARGLEAARVRERR